MKKVRTSKTPVATRVLTLTKSRVVSIHLLYNIKHIVFDTSMNNFQTKIYVLFI